MTFGGSASRGFWVRPQGFGRIQRGQILCRCEKIQRGQKIQRVQIRRGPVPHSQSQRGHKFKGVRKFRQKIQRGQKFKGVRTRKIQSSSENSKGSGPEKFKAAREKFKGVRSELGIDCACPEQERKNWENGGRPDVIRHSRNLLGKMDGSLCVSNRRNRSGT